MGIMKLYFYLHVLSCLDVPNNEWILLVAIVFPKQEKKKCAWVLVDPLLDNLFFIRYCFLVKLNILSEVYNILHYWMHIVKWKLNDLFVGGWLKLCWVDVKSYGVFCMFTYVKIFRYTDIYSRAMKITPKPPIQANLVTNSNLFFE